MIGVEFLIWFFNFWFGWNVIIWCVLIGMFLLVFGLWLGCLFLLCRLKLLKFDSFICLLDFRVFLIFLKKSFIRFFVLCLLMFSFLNRCLVILVLVNVIVYFFNVVLNLDFRFLIIVFIVCWILVFFKVLFGFCKWSDKVRFL